MSLTEFITEPFGYLPLLNIPIIYLTYLFFCFTTDNINRFHTSVVYSNPIDYIIISKSDHEGRTNVAIWGRLVGEEDISSNGSKGYFSLCIVCQGYNEKFILLISLVFSLNTQGPPG